MSTSTAKVKPNRANAKDSSKDSSKDDSAVLSAPKIQAATGLTGRTVLLPTEDIAAYESLIASMVANWQPATPEEQRLTQALCDTEWRLLRIPELESGIYALGFRELANEFADIEDAAARRSAICTRIYLTHIRQLNSLGTQESRLRRQREKDSAALKHLQDERKAEVNRRLDEAAQQYIQALENRSDEDGEDPAPSAYDEETPLCAIAEKFGFEFSKSQIELRALDIQPDLFDAWLDTHAGELAA